MSKLKVLGMIPARFLSSRFPGKPLAMVLGKSLLQHTYENGKKCSLLDDLVIATDDQRIFDHALSFGAKVILTSTTCLTGTDRLQEALTLEPKYQDYDLIVNLQGDEPCVEESILEKLVTLLEEDPIAQVATAITSIKTEEELDNLSVVKCVTDLYHNALYFSRQALPGSKVKGMKTTVAYYRHIGIYIYRKSFLMRYKELSPTPLQLAEDLEQLKILENGYRIKVAYVNYQGIDVNHFADIQKLEHYLS